MLANGEAHLVREHVERDGIVDVAEELAELEHRLARQDDFLALIVTGDREARPRKAMPIGRDGLQRPAVDDEQHPVEVVPDVLLRHREFDRFQQPPQFALR